MCRMHFGMPDTNLISLQPSDDDDVYEGVTVDFADDIYIMVKCMSVCLYVTFLLTFFFFAPPPFFLGGGNYF